MSEKEWWLGRNPADVVALACHLCGDSGNERIEVGLNLWECSSRKACSTRAAALRDASDDAQINVSRADVRLVLDYLIAAKPRTEVQSAIDRLRKQAPQAIPA